MAKSPKLLLPFPTSGPCPTCGYRWMNMQAKDQNSGKIDWVTCGSCSYAAGLDTFRTQLAAARNKT